jgi:RHS repeat-associated protein
VTVLDADWTERSGGSEYAWHYLHQGGRFDDVSGLYHFRYRDYSPTLGRWTSLDPLRYDAGDVNLYRTVFNAPTVYTDAYGLQHGVGHHWIPLQVICDPEIQGRLTDEAIDIALGAYSGQTYPNHRYKEYGGVKHSEYNKIVKRELLSYIEKK